MNFWLTLSTFSPIWIKIGIRELHIMQINSVSFVKTGCRRCRTFRMGFNEKRFTRVQWNSCPCELSTSAEYLFSFSKLLDSFKLMDNMLISHNSSLYFNLYSLVWQKIKNFNIYLSLCFILLLVAIIMRREPNAGQCLKSCPRPFLSHPFPFINH